MGKNKSTKRALLVSATSLLLCVAMLVGTTFAWFTDSVTSGVNKIQAGNLDIDVEYNVLNDNGTLSENWKNLDGSEKLFTGNLWEPGHTEYAVLRIKNNGTLALKYKALVSVVGETGSVSVETGERFKLSDFLYYGVAVSEKQTEPTVTRMSAVGMAETKLGSMTTEEYKLAAKTETPVYNYVTLAVTMPTGVGNEANYDKAFNAPSVDLGVTVVATQDTVESDSFGKDYDDKAEYPESKFVPTTDVVYPVKVEQTVSAEAASYVITQTVSNVEVAKATVSNVKVNDTVIMSVIPTESTSKGYTLANDQVDKSFDIEVTVNGTKQPNVPMSIYVGKGLNHVQLYHANETTPITPITYDPETGMLSFTAPSFSEYHVVYDAPKHLAKVGGNYYENMRDAANALSAENYTLELIDEEAWPAATPVYWQTATKSGFSNTFKAALEEAYKANEGDIVVVCRPGADAGQMTHGHVADNLTVYGNHAYISSGEHNIEIDTFPYSRETGTKVDNGGEYLNKAVTVSFYAMDGIAAWGERHTDHDINLKFVDCQNMNRIYFSGKKATVNIDVDKCSFDGTKYGNKNTSIKTESAGTWNITNTTFKDVGIAIALTNASGEATLNVSNCTFMDVATKTIAAEVDAVEYASPIRVLGRSAAQVTIDKCEFVYTGNAEKNTQDIVFGERRASNAAENVVTYTVKNTKGSMEVVQTHSEVSSVEDITKVTELDGTEVSGSNAAPVA